MNPLLLLNLIVLVTLVDSLGFIVYDLDEEISKADFANVHYYWMIYVCKNNLSQVYLHALALHPSNHITSHYKVRWLAKHDDYLQEGVQNLIDCPIHLLSNPKPPSKLSISLIVDIKRYAPLKLRNNPWEKLMKVKNVQWLLQPLLHNLNFLLEVALTMWVRTFTY